MPFHGHVGHRGSRPLGGRIERYGLGGHGGHPQSLLGHEKPLADGQVLRREPRQRRTRVDGHQEVRIQVLPDDTERGILRVQDRLVGHGEPSQGTIDPGGNGEARDLRMLQGVTRCSIVVHGGMGDRQARVVDPRVHRYREYVEPRSRL